MIKADAPGRVNLIGEHTDYNGGPVLPMPIRQRTVVELTPRDDRRVSVESGGERLEYVLGEERKDGRWLDYVKGVTFVAAAQGHALRGFDARISSDVPIGSGLSSSAALEVALLRALREAFSLELYDIELALLAQRAETRFVGARIGVMDQMASSLGREREALHLDARTLEFRRVPLPESCEIAVVDSGLRHSHAGGEYNARRAECDAAAAKLGVPLLAQARGVEGLAGAELRRARHVITETARVERAVRALEAGDLPAAGALLYEAHASMRDDFEASAPELDFLVERARSAPGVHGARLTGGGFGGCVILLADRGAGLDAGRALAADYERRWGRKASVLLA